MYVEMTKEQAGERRIVLVNFDTLALSMAFENLLFIFFLCGFAELQRSELN